MRRPIILPLAALMALLSCAERAFEYDNPLDERGNNYGYKLTISAKEGGSVDATRDGEMSVTDATRTYKPGTSVTVTATPDNNNAFTVWSGASTSANPSITITMDGNKTLTANFLDTANRFFDSRDNRTYGKVKIGAQTWMAENLNYDVTGSKCYGDGGKVHYSGSVTGQTISDAAVQANCAKYGRLYNWATAMGIEWTYNNTTWNGSDVMHQGVCPVGWHLPTDDEWTTLTEFVGSDAGKKLRSGTGWTFFNYNSLVMGISGTDEYGFSALPGGLGYSDGDFGYAGDNGYWWSATDAGISEEGDLVVWGRVMSYSASDVSRVYLGKTASLPVRCVADYCVGNSCNYTITFNSQNGSAVDMQSIDYGGKITEPAIPPTRAGYTFGGWYKDAACNNAWNFATDVVTSTVTLYAKWDWIGKGNDINNYRTVTIGTQTWMAENLDYDVEGSKCYGNSMDSCAKYGRMYNWSTAMKGASSSNKVPSGVQGVCPIDWHLPSEAEWDILMTAVGGESTAGTKLKSKIGWTYRDCNGTDEYGFSALPGGLGSSDGYFSNYGGYGNWWSTTEDDADGVWYWNMNCHDEGVHKGGNSTEILFSVRCVED